MYFFEILKIIALSVVEGITEWLPISSTAHLELSNEILKIGFSEDFYKLYIVVIQLGAILAVVVLYFSKLNPFSNKKTTKQKKQTWSLWLKIAIGCLPAVVAGLIFDKKIDSLLDGGKRSGVVMGVSLIFYGIIFLVVEDRITKLKTKPSTNKVEDISFKDSIKVGLFQVLALIPGTSRSGSTIIGGLISKISREAVTEFTFFMAIPIMIGASLLKIVKYKGIPTMFELWGLTLSLVITFAVSIFVIKAVINYIKRNNFKIFGWYRIVIGLIVLIYFFIK